MSLCYALLLTILVLSGCAGATIEELEDQLKICKREAGDCVELEKALDKRFERYYLDMENAQRWETCKLVYAKLGRTMRTDHDHKRWRKHTAMDVKLDLAQNNCRMLLKHLNLW